jgi:hypothetical protein
VHEDFVFTGSAVPECDQFFVRPLNSGAVQPFLILADAKDMLGHAR